MSQVWQLVGALLILVAFVLAQAHRLSQRSYAYLWLNFAGSGVLAWVALDSEQWGFLLLEGVWALVSAWGIVQRFRRG